MDGGGCGSTDVEPMVVVKLVEGGCSGGCGCRTTHGLERVVGLGGWVGVGQCG